MITPTVKRILISITNRGQLGDIARPPLTGCLCHPNPLSVCQTAGTK